MNWKHQCIFWGKFWRSAERVFCLPLSVHCVDVAIVFRGLTELPGFRRMLESTAGRPLTPQDCDRLAVLALLHDAGKSNLGFQYKVFDMKAPRAGHIRELAPLFDTPELGEAFAQALDYTTLEAWFQPSEAVDSFLLATWSHHGRPVQFQGEKTGNYDLARGYWWRRQDAWDPMEAVAELMASARQVFPQAFALNGEPVPSAPRFQHRFAGLVMLADWLGSHRNYFPVRRVSLPTRIDADRETVPRMLRTLGLDVQTVRSFTNSIPASFQERFGFLPCPLQEQIAGLDPDDPEARLLIAESETGSGKTEAALYWFFTLFATGKIDGLYFALPTRVAARKLYVRVRHYIERWFPDPELRPVTVLAVPGYAQIDGIPAERILPEDSTRWQDDPHERLRERVWAAEHPKRFLAATVAVGTIDQALLSVIQTAHAHLRSVCLDRSLLVVDEVHASDAYMSRLLEALLRHHLDAGGRAMLLSATLGARARSGFLGATGCQMHCRTNGGHKRGPTRH